MQRARIAHGGRILWAEVVEDDAVLSLPDGTRIDAADAQWLPPVKPADTMYENTGLPHSDALHMVERIHLTAPDDLVDELTFTDSKVLTRPWTAAWHFRRHRDWTILDCVCEENNQNPDIGGVTVVR